MKLTPLQILLWLSNVVELITLPPSSSSVVGGFARFTTLVYTPMFRLPENEYYVAVGAAGAVFAGFYVATIVVACVQHLWSVFCVPKLLCCVKGCNPPSQNSFHATSLEKLSEILNLVSARLEHCG